MDTPVSGNPKRHGLSSKLKMTTLIPIVSVVALVALFSWYFSPLNTSKNAHAAGFAAIAGVVPNAVTGSSVSSQIDGSTPVTLVIGLKLHNQDGLAQYVKETSATKNKVQRTLTPQQLIEAYSPLPAEQQAVIDYMQSYGFTTISTDSYRLLVGFQGTMAQAQSAFNVTVNNYSNARGNFYAPASNPTLPAGITPYISSIIGLDNTMHYTHAPITATSGRGQTAANTSVSNSGSTSCPPAGSAAQFKANGHTTYIPSQITSAYNLGPALQQKYKGEGQTVGLIELSDYRPQDIQAYTNCYGGSTVPISKKSVSDGSITGDTAAIDDGTIEAELDMELVLSTAPHLAGLNVYEGPNTTAGNFLAWDNAIAPSTSNINRGTNDTASVISTSWSSCELDTSPELRTEENTLFMIAAAQGQTILAASGDTGSNNGADLSECRSYATKGVLGVQDPASQPYVTGVGASSLQINSNNTYNSETPWNWFSRGRQAATGGGASQMWFTPSWQQAATYPAISDYREVPDISFNGDPDTGYWAYVYNTTDCPASTNYTCWLGLGGTSASAPMMAGLIALANQYALSQGYFNLGFINPALYSLAQNSSLYAADFHDLTTGNNNIDGGTDYPATPGYDMASGLGTPASGELFTDLADSIDQATGARATPAATQWYFAEGDAGSGFLEYFTILNPSATQPANINFTYLYADGRAPKTVTHVLAPSTRGTYSANTDLGYPYTGSAGAEISTIVTSVPNTNGVTVPIVAERPMYFKFANKIDSGTDVLGATDATQTDFYFAYGDTRQSGAQSYYTYITLLNPNTTPVTVTGTYYAGGQQVGTKTITLQPMQRGTLSPADVGLHEQVSMQVHASAGIVAERPMYAQDNIAQAGGNITGAASVVGATAPGSDWLFAEGSTAKNFQENLVLSNFKATDTTAQVTLEYSNGTQQVDNVPVPALSQVIFDVNKNTVSTGTTDVSIAVHDPNSSIVAERLVYFTFFNGTSNITGLTDAIGENSTNGHTAYSFSEGNTNGQNYEFLTLQNPSTNTVHAIVTLYDNQTVIQKTLTLAPQSRTTLTVNAIINSMVQAYAPHDYNVSLTVQGQGTDKVVAERVFYFVVASIYRGATAFPGYTNSQYQ